MLTAAQGYGELALDRLRQTLQEGVKSLLAEEDEGVDPATQHDKMSARLDELRLEVVLHEKVSQRYFNELCDELETEFLHLDDPVTLSGAPGLNDGERAGCAAKSIGERW